MEMKMMTMTMATTTTSMEKINKEEIQQHGTVYLQICLILLLMLLLPKVVVPSLQQIKCRKIYA